MQHEIGVPNWWMPPRRLKDNDVFVANIPYDVTEKELGSIFSQVGSIRKINLLQDASTGTNRGMATITYFSPESTVIAAEVLHKINLKGRSLRVSSAYAEELNQAARSVKLADVSGDDGVEGYLFNVVDSVQSAQTVDGPKSGQELELTTRLSTLTGAAGSFSLEEQKANFKKLLLEVKQLVMEDTNVAISVFEKNPSILFAILHVLFSLDESSDGTFCGISSSYLHEYISSYDFMERDLQNSKPAPPSPESSEESSLEDL